MKPNNLHYQDAGLSSFMNWIWVAEYRILYVYRILNYQIMSDKSEFIEICEFEGTESVEVETATNGKKRL